MKQLIKKGNVYIANLNPGHKSEPRKIRPVVVIQTDLLNNIHPSTIICPITSKVVKGVELLRVNIKKGEAGLNVESDILVDQIRAIDNSRFQKHLGALKKTTAKRLQACIQDILD